MKTCAVCGKRLRAQNTCGLCKVHYRGSAIAKERDRLRRLDPVTRARILQIQKESRRRKRRDPRFVEQERIANREAMRKKRSTPAGRRLQNEKCIAWNHNITVEELRLLRARGRCDICDAATPGGQGWWHIDHDHATGKVRGLLCHRCNTRVVPTVERWDLFISRARAYLANPPGVYGRPTAVAS